MKSNHAQAASIIRKQLKAHGIQASVRSSYDSITINTQDLMPATIEQISAYVSQFELGHFDGMTDCYEYSNVKDDIPQVRFVFLHNDYSEELMQAAWDYIRNYYYGLENAPLSFSVGGNYWCDSHHCWGSHLISRELRDKNSKFWTPRKKRLVA